MNKQSKITGTSVIPCAVVSAAPASPHSAGAATFPDDGWGSQPRCITCRKGMSNCLCDAPDIDVPSVTDMKRIYPSLFEDRGWALAERSAYGMAVKL